MDTSHWRPGPRVVDLSYLNPRTVIANFVFDRNGRARFPNKHGYHAALFMGFGGRSVSTGKVMRIQVWING
ncbi:BPSL0067 family protein [Telluria aromaticivorans]|uniref:BPSL0067 family protein n=1 Tax=Telluria aromaticivorans TaxID=2725995 RepID=UPI003531444C